MHAGWWRTTRPRQCCSEAGHPRLAGLYLRQGNECVAVFPQLRSPAVPWISCAHEAGRRCQGAPHPPSTAAEGWRLGPATDPCTLTGQLFSRSAVYPSGPRLSWALWVWLPGVSGPVCGQIGLGRASWRAASGAVGVQGHLGGSLGCRACLSCSCVFFPMLFGGPETREVHSCVHGAHTLPTPTATQILKCLRVFGSPGPVCLHTFPHVCAWRTHVCRVHACLQQCVWMWSVRVYLCMQINTWGEGVSVCGVHGCLWNVFMARTHVCV